ncbi:hypothetical protein F5883DRAFT_655563 [Diaporthe sp. PMI_573]|nr:hypothetical protein F5883DRAFT_655563 [Diaporthaceae sp. PMI_573]
MSPTSVDLVGQLNFFSPVTMILWLLPIVMPYLAHANMQDNSFPLTGSVKVTPHDKFSSTIGAFGCKVDVNRIAYWPYWPDCSDVSGGAHDISFDTFQYLAFGSFATSSPAILDFDS